MKEWLICSSWSETDRTSITDRGVAYHVITEVADTKSSRTGEIWKQSAWRVRSTPTARFRTTVFTGETAHMDARRFAGDQVVKLQHGR